MKKILFIIGSLRAKSFNRQVANVAKEMIGNRAEVQELDYSDLPLHRSAFKSAVNAHSSMASLKDVELDALSLQYRR